MKTDGQSADGQIANGQPAGDRIANGQKVSTRYALAHLVGFSIWAIVVAAWCVHHNGGFAKAKYLSGRVIAGPFVVALVVGSSAATLATGFAMWAYVKSVRHVGLIAVFGAVLSAIVSLAMLSFSQGTEGVYARRSSYVLTAHRSAMVVTISVAILLMICAIEAMRKRGRARTVSSAVQADV